MAGLTRIAFFDALGRFGVTPFQYTWEEALAEARQISQAEQAGA